jgi:FlaA1/EpsC-like NDP-sugar epimerase
VHTHSTVNKIRRSHDERRRGRPYHGSLMEPTGTSANDFDLGVSERETVPGRIVAHLRQDAPLAILDVAVVLAAYLFPLVLRFEGAVPSGYWTTFWTLTPLLIAVHLAANLGFRLYGHMWRYASIEEARRVIWAASAAGAVVVVLNETFGGNGRLLPLSVVVFGGFLALLGFGAIRFQTRLFAFRRRIEASETKRVLIVGAGDAGEMVLRDVVRNPALRLYPVGIVDDDPRKRRRTLHGVPVLGVRKDIPNLAAKLAIDQVILAIPSATGNLVRDVVACCEQAEVILKVLPSVRDIVGGRVSVRDVRDLRIDDFLGREPVETDLRSVRSILRGKRVLITGAGGSIGSEICHQVASFEPAELLLMDHDETHLYDVSRTLRIGPEPQLLLADIRNAERVQAIFAKHRPEVVFHAAAHKHVPFLESHPEEAVLTNLIGTANVADAAQAVGAERFVLISTDKAIRPTSVMGASKWLAEQILWSLHGRNGCLFSAVRFGNVLGSRGSVIPTFFKQIARGEPVTITDPDMARFFMSVREAVQLVLQAAALSTGGEVFTLQMGEPITIIDLARRVIRMSGRVPDKDVEITIVGARPGEKLIEEIVDTAEEAVASEHSAIYVARPPAPNPGDLRRRLREIEMLAAEGRSDELAVRIKEMAWRPDQAVVPAVELTS